MVIRLPIEPHAVNFYHKSALCRLYFKSILVDQDPHLWVHWYPVFVGPLVPCVCGSTGTLCFRLGLTSLWLLKPGWIHNLCSPSLVFNVPQSHLWFFTCGPSNREKHRGVNRQSVTLFKSICKQKWTSPAGFESLIFRCRDKCPANWATQITY